MAAVFLCRIESVVSNVLEKAINKDVCGLNDLGKIP